MYLLQEQLVNSESELHHGAPAAAQMITVHAAYSSA